METAAGCSHQGFTVPASELANGLATIQIPGLGQLRNIPTHPILGMLFLQSKTYLKTGPPEAGLLLGVGVQCILKGGGTTLPTGTGHQAPH